jgi:Integrase core domain
VIIKPATLLKFHKTLVDGKYRRLFSSSGRPRKPGPKGPSAQLSVAVWRMFNRASAGQSLPQHISTDHDPLFRFHRWLANLRVLEIDEIKTVPQVPVSHPFVERLIGTIRREFLDRMFFWNALDLERKLQAFRGYYNAVAFISRSAVVHRRKRLASLALAVPHLIPTDGRSIAGGFSRRRSPPAHEFAMHR